MKEKQKKISLKEVHLNLIKSRIKRLIQFIRKHPWKTFFKVCLTSMIIIILIVIAIFLTVRNRIYLKSFQQTPFFEDTYGNYLCEGRTDKSVLGFWEITGKLPERISESFISIEDKRFLKHSGVDWHSLFRAIINNITGKSRQGASTIPMQLARMQNPGSRTYWRKACEIVTALLMMRKYGHDAVMRQYLRLVPQGNQIHGVAYSARRYFRKPLKDLGWAEAALLASLSKAPGKMNLFRSDGFWIASKRAKIILLKLKNQGKLSNEEYRMSISQLKKMDMPVKEERPFHSYHAILNLEHAIKKTGKKTFSKPIRTCLDLGIQDFLANVAIDAMNLYRPRGAGNIAIMLVEKSTGKIRGYIGSEYYQDKEYSGAINYAKVPRSSGSILKPFIYALGIKDHHYTPASVIADLPLYITHKTGDYSVSNYDESFLGPMIYRKALANSRNIPAVQVLKRVGLSRCYDFFRHIGLVNSLKDASYYGLGMAIGGLYITLENIATAYGMLANDGHPFKLKWFEHEDSENSKIEVTQHILPEDIARQITLFLADPMARLPSFGRMGVLEYPFPVAIKTGTSNGYRDGWAVAWSYRYIIGVWIGHPNNDRMKKLGGQSAAAVVKRIMLHLHPEEETHGVHETPFLPPKGYIAVKMCSISGQSATDLCSDVMLEYFKPGTEPVSSCKVHRKYAIDRSTGKLASQFTLAEDIEHKTFTLFPPEYSAWAARNGYIKPPTDTNHIPNAYAHIQEPINGSHLLLDPETPLRFQTLALKAKVSPLIPEVVWMVDGVQFKTSSYPYVARWQLKPGFHAIQVRFPNANVQSKVVYISVSE